MPLRLAQAPLDAFETVREGLRALQRRRLGGAKLSALNDLSQLHLRATHPVYDLRVDELAAGAGLAAAHLTAFRSLVADPDGSFSAAEVAVTADEKGAFGASKFSQLNSGPFVKATEDAVRAFEALPEADEDSYELRLLRCAALHFVALWLEPDGPGERLFLPLEPTPGWLARGTLLLREKELAGPLQSAAAVKLTHGYHP